MKRTFVVCLGALVFHACSSPSGGVDASTAPDAAVIPSDAATTSSPDASIQQQPCTVPDAPCALANGNEGLCCGSVCVDVTSDPQNCGACSLACPLGQKCEGSQCLATSCNGLPDFASCVLPGDAGAGTCCGGACSGGSDPANCGSCGVVCATGATCSQGQCSTGCTTGTCPNGLVCTQASWGAVCLSASCAGRPDGDLCSVSANASGACCGGTCVDTSSDPLNCGACFWTCAQGSVCLGGGCQATADCTQAVPGSLCQVGDGGLGTCCGDCVHLDSQTDPLNCGGCGYACSTGTTCTGGLCMAPDGGESWCSQGQSCPSGYACAQSTCLHATCTTATPMEPCALANQAVGACCGSSCVDLDQDSANCGTCGNACGPGSFCYEASCQSNPMCTAANSGVACPLGSGGIGQCCSGACVDIHNDLRNCTGCGLACPSGEICDPSMAPACNLGDAGFGTACEGNIDACPAGSVCWQGYCVTGQCPPGASGIACAFGNNRGQCCNGRCTDLSQDPQNCGSCGAACASGVCYSSLFGMPGQCLPAADGGTCGFGSCPPGLTCVAGQCVSAGCQGPAGLCAASTGNAGVCCQDFFSTTCADLTSDSSNCGNCGVACPSGQTCTNGACSGDLPPCGVGRNGAYCDLDAGTSHVCCPGGGCIDLESDSANCGYCGNGCTPGLICLSGSCLAVTCTTNLAGQNCAEGDGGVGLCCGTSCLDVSNDPKNCGGCGNSCVSTETCRGGGCGFDTCTASLQGDPCHRSVSGFLETGTCCGTGCVDTTSDPANCGGCNLACGADAGCSNGVCQ